MTENSHHIPRNLDVILPSTGDNAFFDDMDVGEIFNFAKICSAAHRKVEAYKRNRFSIYRILDRFFEHVDSVEFRYLMRSTGTIISGSCALQLFAREYYPDSDLDLFVSQPEASRVAEWLISRGYEFKLTPTQEEFNVTYEDLTGESDPFEGPEFFTQLCKPYRYDMFDVLNFEAKDPLRKVQIVTASDNPLCMILNFHSTVVFNVITHSKAYCLYPKATLLEKRNLLNNWRGSVANREHLLKYKQRGWSIQSGLFTSEFLNPTSSFSNGLRSFGDDRCWTITFQRPAVGPAREEELNKLYPFEGAEDNVEIDSWISGIDGARDFCNYAYVFHSSRLSRPYIMPMSLHLDKIVAAIEELQREHPQVRYLDKYLTSCYKQ